MAFKKRKICLSILAATAVSHNAFAARQLEELIVTAQKRTETVQDVPLAVQSFNQQALEEQNISSFADYVKYLPSVNFGGRGPGQNEIYIRGATTQAVNIATAESQGSAPNVALYLDDQPVTAGGRNLDIYITDMERIEVLPGPQGTLYGASSQAGTVRLITNKPQLDAFDMEVHTDLSTTTDGEASTAVEAMFNFPLIEDKLAARLAVFRDSQGGYVDNVAGVFVPEGPNLPNPQGVQFVPASGSPTAHQFADGSFAVPGRTYRVQHTPVANDSLVEEDFNDADYTGFRASLKYIINDDWELTLAHHGQNLKTDGVFDYDPTVGDLQVQRFTPDTLDEDFAQTSWTVDGRLGALDVIYSGGYLNRETEQIADYSAYTESGLFVAGYTCEYNTPGYHGTGGVGYSFDPTLSGDPSVIDCRAGNAFFDISNEQERFIHEFRISSDPDNTARFTAGVYYEDLETRHIGDFAYGDPTWRSVDPSQLNGGAGPITANDRGVRESRIQFVNDVTRPEEQVAVFGEASYDIGDFTATVGARYYELDVGFVGFSAWKYGNRVYDNLAGVPGVTVAPNVTGGRDYETNLGDFQPAKTDDVISKFTLKWSPDESTMLYATRSEGFRPSGFNRAAAVGRVVANADGSAPTVAAVANDGDPQGDGDGVNDFPDYFIPVIYQSDEMTSTEFGWKMTLLDGAMRFNGALFQIAWDNIQTGHIDSDVISLFTVVDNAGDAKINGIEGDLTWAVNDNLTLYSAFSYLDTEVTRNNPSFDFAVVDVGHELSLAPTFQANARARYVWEMTQGLAHAQVAVKYAGASYSSLIEDDILLGTGNVDTKDQESYSLLDMSVGLERGKWAAEVYVDNATNELAQLHINNLDESRRITSNRPRTVGLRFSYRFNN